MEESVWFLNLEGLNDRQVQCLQVLLHPSNPPSEIEFPWSSSYGNEDAYSKTNLSSLNVHAPAFEAYVSAHQSHTSAVNEPQRQTPQTVPYTNSSNIQTVQVNPEPQYYDACPVRTLPQQQVYSNGQPMIHNMYDQRVTYSQPPKPFNGEYYSPVNKVSSFKLNPTVSSFVPQNIESFMHPEPFSNGQQKQVKGFTSNVYASGVVNNESYGVKVSEKGGNEYVTIENSIVMNINESNAVKASENVALNANESVISVNESIMKTNENVMNVVESVRKANENVVKVNEDIVKASESDSKVDNLVEARDNVVTKFYENVKSYKDEATKPSKEIVQKQSSTEAVWNGGKPDIELKEMGKVKDSAVEDKVIVDTKAEVQESQQVFKPVRRSWADIVSKGQKPAEKSSPLKPVNENEKPFMKSGGDQETEASIAEDKMSLVLGKHLFGLELNFNPVLLQPRGLINRRNWCYINATLQALLACPSFYTLLRNLPLGPGVERGKSSTPVIDSMVKVTYEFLKLDKLQEDLQLGQPFQPDFIYDMLRDLKSDCLKGQQEDAEEFLSFILNGMHEEMVKIIKYYEKKNHLELECETKENGGVSDGEEEWQVIGSKHKGMVTRKVAEHKTPISDLLGGQIKSFLTTNGNKTSSASIQPFFTLQLDVQSENVNSVSEALKEMTIKEPIQGYTCAKTKQEVEAYSHIALQKLPPILILHLKRFVYNKNGGCKKVMKKTDYPLLLEINRDMFSPDVKKSQRLRQYKLFAVMYHDGEEAVKGHYISDVYNHGSQTWIRCDDRILTAVTEEQVLSYSPPRVPYLLFYQES